MEKKNVQFLGWDCVELTNGHLTLRVTQSLGPRIIFLALPGGKNIMAELPDFVVPPPIGGPFRILGGHRLWHGPEKEVRSYLSDDKEPVEITLIENGVHVTQETDAAGVQKMLDIRLAPDKAQVTVTGSLKNDGFWPIETYPWGLTQVRPGGFVMLPQNTDPLDQYGLTANRSLVMWPYSKISDPRLLLGDRYIFVHADPAIGDPVKIGYGNRRGWLAYYIDRSLLVKNVPYQEGGNYPDMGCSSEIYNNDQFMELEVTAPLNTLEPGQIVSLTEKWTLFDNVDLEPNEDRAAQVAETLGLDSLCV